MINRILSLGEKAVYSNGKMLYDRGKPATTVFYIIKGVVVIETDHPSSMTVGKKGLFLGLTEAISEGMYTTDASVFTYAEVIVISAEKLIGLSEKDSEVQEFLIRQISHLPHLLTLPFE